MFLYWSDVLSLLLLSSKKSGESETTPTTPTTPTSPSAPTTPTSPTTPTLPPRVTSFPPPPVTTDSVRNKCRELLVAALQTDGEDGFISCFHDLETLTRPGGSLTSSEVSMTSWGDDDYFLSLISFVSLWCCETRWKNVWWSFAWIFTQIYTCFFSSLKSFHGWNLSKNNKCFVCEMEF